MVFTCFIHCVKTIRADCTHSGSPINFLTELKACSGSRDTQRLRKKEGGDLPRVKGEGVWGSKRECVGGRVKV